VTSPDELRSIAARLEEAGVELGEVVELGGFGIAILSFGDPDGLHLELSAPL
jgi:hypothetical protein